jgi:hypothetical protein
VLRDVSRDTMLIFVMIILLLFLQKQNSASAMNSNNEFCHFDVCYVVPCDVSMLIFVFYCSYRNKVAEITWQDICHVAPCVVSAFKSNLVFFRSIQMIGKALAGSGAICVKFFFCASKLKSTFSR